MRVKTCLRYPGGKFYGFKKIKKYLNIPHETYVEVFVGGASIFLGKEPAENNWLNDKDESLINFYHVLQNQKDRKALFKMLENETVTKLRYKKVLRMNPSTNVEKAYKYFYLNRTSFSGIMKNPRWGYMIGSSVTPDKWIERITPVAETLLNARVTCLDFREVLSEVDSNALVYLDPPYFEASKGIYSQEFNRDDHYDLMEILKSSNFNFVLSYNNHPELYEMYKWSNVSNEEWVYYMSESRRSDGKELIISNMRF